MSTPQVEVEFGVEFPLGTDILTKHLYCYLLRLTQAQGALGPDAHFWEIVNILWGPDNQQKKFIRNPWADKMISCAHEHQYLAVSGAASSGKTDTYSVYALVNWLANPAGTMVLITSTSLKESRGRVWGSIEEYFNSAQKHVNNALPAKLVSSVGMIKLDDPSGEIKTSDRSGVHLIAGEKKKEQDTIGKLIGLKAPRVIFVADELPELSPAILTAAFSNLSANPFFQLIGIGNPNSIYDAHGVFSRPKDGWKSVSSADEEWVTEKGYHIRFDGERSPNILAGRVIYPWMMTQAKIEAKKHDLGEDSLSYYRMVKAYWCATGGTESVVAEADIIGYDCESKVKKWKNDRFIRLAFLDPGFTNGGDRSIAYFANYGVADDTGLETLEFAEFIMLFADTTKKDESHSFQVATKYKLECEKRNIPPELAGVDDTGAAAFGDIVHTLWSRLVRRTQFGGSASKLPVSAHDKKLSCDKYANRVTEIWCSIREYMRGNQIRGICPDLAIELTARKMTQNKRGVDLKALVESKQKMRDRTGKSPDIADAALGLLDLLRSKHRFRAAAKQSVTAVTHKNWKTFVKKIGDRLIPVGLDRSA